MKKPKQSAGEKEQADLERKWGKLNDVYTTTLYKTKSIRSADRAVGRAEKIPTFADQLKAYYRENNKLKLANDTINVH